MLKDLDFVGYRYVCFDTLPRAVGTGYGTNELQQVPGGPHVLCHLCDVPTTINNLDPKDWSSKISIIDHSFMGNLDACKSPRRPCRHLLTNQKFQSMGFAKTWSQVLAIRILLGVFAAGYFPGCMYLLSCWYLRCRFSYFLLTLLMHN